MINFNQEGLSFKYQPENESQEKISIKSNKKTSVYYKHLNARGEVTETTHARIHEIFTLIDKKLVSPEINTDRTCHHTMVVQLLTSDSFLIKIDNETAFTLSIGDEESVERTSKSAIRHKIGKESQNATSPFSKPLPLESNLLSGINDKKLAFIQGDTFIRRSGLEGGDTTSNMKFFMPFVESNPHLKGNIDLVPLQECLLRETQERPTFNADSKNAHQIYHVLMKIYAKKLAEQTEQLEAGKKLILSGGWSSTGSGHAMIYIIEKTDSETCSFTILNTGAGLEKYHSSQRVGYKENYRPMVRLNGIDVQQLTKPDIFESLLELQVSIQPEGNSWEHDSSDIYERIVPALQGKRDHDFEEKFSLITAQRSGTCAWKVLMKLIQVLVETDSKSSEPYKKFTFDLRRDSLKAFYNKIVNRELEMTDERLQLLKLSTENFARSALKQHQAGLITDLELADIKSLSHIILGDVGRFSILSKTIPPLDFRFNDYAAATLPAKLFEVHTPATGVIDENSRALLSTQVPAFDTFPASPQELNALLKNVVTSCKELQSQNAASTSMRKIVELIKAIPTSSLQPGGYWERLCTQASKEEVEQTIALINEVSLLYFSGITLIPENERGTPDQYATQLILLAATDKLIDALPLEYNPFKEMIRLNRIPQQAIWNRNPYAIVNDIRLRQLISESRKFCLDKCTPDTSERFLLSPEIFIEFKHGNFKNERFPAVADEKSIFEELYKIPNFKEKVIKKWPELKNVNDYQLHKKVITEFNEDLKKDTQSTNDLFPPFIFAELVQVMRLAYFSKNPHLQNINPEKGGTAGKLQFALTFLDDRIKHEGMLTGISYLNRQEWPLEKTVLFRDKAPNNQFNRIPIDNQPKFESGLHLEIKNSGLAKVFLPSPYTSLTLNSNIWTEDSNKAILLRPVEGLSRHETQQLAYFFSNDLIRIPALISYFKEQPTKLLDRDYQLFLFHGLFSGDVLESQIENNSVIKKTLVDFLEGQYVLHKNMGNVQQELYFLWILDKLSKTITIPSPESASKLRGLISRIKETHIEAQGWKALAYRQLIATHKGKADLSNAECAELIKAYVFVKVMGYNHDFSHPSIGKDIQETMMHVKKHPKIFDESFYLPLLQDISKECLDVTDSQWEQGDNGFINLKSGYCINLQAFTISHDQDLIGGLPEVILREPQFQTLFSINTVIAKIQKSGMYTFSLPTCSEENKSIDYQLFYSQEDSRLKIQKCINGHWHTYLQPETIREFLPSNALVEGHHHWLAKTDDGKACINIERRESEQLAAVVHLNEKSKNSPKSPYTIDSIVKIDPEQKNNQLHLKDIYDVNTPLEQLFTFQPKDQILLWGNQHSPQIENQTLEFPKLNIDFHFDTKGHWIYSGDSKYKIAEHQTRPTGLSKFNGFIKIESIARHSKRKYIIPKNPVNLTGTVKSQLKTDKKTEHQEDNYDFFEFKEINGKLVGKTVEENLYLAYLHFAHKNYEEAFAFLSQTLAGKPLGYDEKEDKIIEWIDTYIKNFDVNTPQAKALQLKILYLKVRNQAPKKDKAFSNALSQTILKALTDFYPVSHHAEILMMTSAEELELLEFAAKNLLSLPQLISIRKAQLEKTAEQVTHQWLGIPKINVYNSEITIPSSIDFKKIDTRVLNRKIQSLQRDEESKPVFFLNGEKKFADEFNQILGLACSDNEHDRKSAITQITLLKIADESKLLPITQMLLLFARRSTAEMRGELKNDTLSRKNPEIDRLKKLCKQIVKKGLHDNSPTTSRDDLSEVDSSNRSTKISTDDRKISSLKTTAKSIKFESPTNFKAISPSVLGILEMAGVPLEIFNKHPKSDPGKLRNSLEPPTDEAPVVKKEFQRVQNSITENHEEIKKTKMLKITPKIYQQLMHKPRIFDIEITDRKRHAEEQIEDILALANQLPIEPTDSLIRSLQLMGKKKREFGIDDLIILFLQKDGAALQERNPSLSEANIQGLSTMLTMYLINTTEIAHLEGLKKSLEALETMKEELKTNALQDLSARILQKREYDPTLENAMLVFEHYSGKRLRKEQVETIHKMMIGHPDEKKNLVAQLIMGSGKSKLILPLLAYLNSKGDNVPMIVVPDSLYETNLEDMRVLSGELLNQEAETLQIAEGEQLSIQKLDQMLRTLQRVKENKSYCLVKSSTVHHLHLYFKEAIIELSKEPIGKDAVERFEKLKKMLNIFKNEVDCIVDEVDMVLDCTKEVNFSAGIRKPLSEISQNSMESIFKGIAKDPKLSAFFSLEKESEAPFDEKEYQKTFKPLLAKMLLEMAGCSQDSQKDMELYLKADDSVKQLPKFMQEANEDNKNLLSLGKECLNTLLPLAMKRNSNEHYGLSKIRAANRAIPYARSNVPSEGSEFSSPYETAIYTMLYTLRKGVSTSQALTLIKKYREEAFNEHLQYGTALDKTAGYAKIQSLALTEQKDIFSVKEHELEGILNKFNGSIERKMQFARQFGWSEIEIYSERLTSNAQNLVGLFHTLKGFTGTLWNQDTYHNDLKAEPDNLLDGKTLTILSENSSIAKNAKDVERLYKSLDGYHACIDSGAWFRGVESIKVATEMLNHLPPTIKGLVYFNDIDLPKGTKGQAVVLGRETNARPTLLSASKLTPQELFTYYNITVGADIVQHPTAKAMTTISKSMTLRDLLQAVWRMRGLDAGQSVNFAVPEGLIDEKEVTSEAIFRLCTMNQAVRQRDDNLKALKQKIGFVVDRCINSVFLSSSCKAQEAIELSAAVKKALSKSTLEDPFILFGGLEKEENIEIVVKAYIQSVLVEFKSVYESRPIFEKTYPWTTLEKEIWNLVNYDILPKREALKNAENYGCELQVRTEAQTEQKTQMNIKLELEIATDTNSLKLKGSSSEPLDLLVNSHNRSKKVSIFSDAGWQSLKPQTLNNYLWEQRDQLIGIDAQNSSVFSKQLAMTHNFLSIGTEGLTNNLIPFHTGSKPVTACALHIDRKQKDGDPTLSLYFLHPNEAEFFSTALNFETEFDLQQITDEYHEKLTYLAETFFDEIEKDKNESIEKIFSSIEPYSLNNNYFKNLGESITKKELIQIFLAKISNEPPSFNFDILNIMSDFLYADCGFVSKYDKWDFEDAVLNKVMLKNWPTVKARRHRKLPDFLWKKGCGYREALELFSKKDFTLVLIDPHNGPINLGRFADEVEALKATPAYIELMAQTKFYNGTLNNYTKAEQEYLKKWIAEKGIDNMLQLLLNNILRNRPDDRELFKTSLMNKLFTGAQK